MKIRQPSLHTVYAMGEQESSGAKYRKKSENIDMHFNADMELFVVEIDSARRAFEHPLFSKPD
jgi:hypothetical protein